MGKYMTLLTNFKKIGVNSALLLTSVTLVACGGGGSDGYFEQPGSGSGSGNESNDNSATIPDSIEVLAYADANGTEIVQVGDSSVVQFKVKVLNKDKGGVESKNVNLVIKDDEKTNISSTSSNVQTATGGIATFELNIPAINAATKKVNLTINIPGTSITQTHVLTIVKKSTIQSEYNLNVQQGVVLNLPKGSAEITAQVTDKNGGVKGGKNVILELSEEMKDKFSISSGSTVVTDAEGKATFTIAANSDLTAEQIKALVGTSQALTFKLVDEYQAEKTTPSSILFKDISDVIDNLEIVKEDEAVIAQGGVTTVKVRAKNTNGVAVGNKKVKLLFTDKSESYGVTVEPVEATTDSNGYATFKLTTNSSYPIALAQQGINIKAVYADGNSEIFAQDTISVKTVDTTATDKLALQRIEIASSYKVNAKNDSVEIRIKGINNNGDAATKGKVTLALNAEALANAVSFDGSAERDFATATEGFITFKLTTKAATEAAIEALVQSGITATFTTDNNLVSEIKIAVESEEKSEEAVDYLLIDPINSSFDYTQDQIIDVKVKVIGKAGSALKGETVQIALPKTLSTDALKVLNLSLVGASSKNTDENGYAHFQYAYKANGSDQQKQLALAGITFKATSVSNSAAESTIHLNFKSPTDQAIVDLDYLTTDLPGDLVLTTGVEQTLSVKVKATGTDGQVYNNQTVGLGLNDAALSNGVSLSTASALVTSNGEATFALKVKANNATELANLIANGITVAVKAYRQDGTAYTVTRKINVSQPPVVLPDLAQITVSQDVTSVSVLGGEIKVKAIAKDANGNFIANTPIAIALSSLTSSRVSLSDSALTTNSKGEVEFTIQIAEGAYDASLIKNGISFAVVGTNLNNGDRIQQTGTVQVNIPADSMNLRLTADKTELEIGQSYQVAVAVKDELGANSTYPVNLRLNPEAIAAGVTLSTDSILTSANGVAPVTIIIPADIPANAKAALFASGIQVIGSITNPRGQNVESTLSFSVFEQSNLNVLTISPEVGKTSLDVKGDRTIVTVNLRDKDGAPLRHEEVRLSALNAAHLTIGTAGSGGLDNTSDPQIVKTDSNGNAFFAVEIGTNATQDLLLASCLELVAEHTNSSAKVATQVYCFNTHRSPDPTPPSEPEPAAARYTPRIEASKTSLNVRGDVVDVTVTLVDQYGGGVADRYVSLGIRDFVRNGAIIVGPSGLTTNENGQATFKVRIDESMRNTGYSAVEFDADDLNLYAEFKEDGYRDASQIHRVNVVQAPVENPIASIVIGVNPTEVAISDDGVYYSRNLSVSVVDLDGKPLANQDIVMDIAPLTYTKGRYIWALAPTVGATPAAQWVGVGGSYFDYAQPGPVINGRLTSLYSDNGVPMNNNGTPTDLTDDFEASPNARNTGRTCSAAADRTAVTNGEVINIPVQVPTFVGKGEGSTATYTTDAEGKFDFTIRYPKIYAQWLSVQIGATSPISTLPVRTTYNLGLPSVLSDYSGDGSWGPNINSPYGINVANCP